jgi:hypothetical protein
VDRKLSSIKESIQARAAEFDEHLKQSLPEKVLEFVEKLQDHTQVYLFSGLIRDFFLKADYELRDVDFVIHDDLEIEKIFPSMKLSKNSFNGYKAKIDSLSVDLWGLQNTWALNHGQLNFPFRKLEYLPETAFFNFSSIVYLLNEKRFVVGKPFLRFMRDKVLDTVLEENPYPTLCIVNSFYYSEKYHLRLSPKLKRYILNHYEDDYHAFCKVQLSHFNRIVYSRRSLTKRVAEIAHMEAKDTLARNEDIPPKSETYTPLFSNISEANQGADPS